MGIPHVDENESIATIHEAFDRSITLLIPAISMAMGTMMLIGRAPGTPRQSLALSQIWGLRSPDGAWVVSMRGPQP
jgi:hypothetical protein